MNPETQERGWRLTAWLALAAYAALSLVFYRERMLFLDGTHFTVEIFQSRCFYTPGNRWSAYITQWLPLAGVWAGAGVGTVLFLYSLNIALFVLAVFSALVGYFRQPLLALAWAIFLWIGTFDSFYMPVSELPTGIGFLLLLLARLPRPVTGWGGTACLLLLGLHVAASHPLLLFVLAFLSCAVLLRTQLAHRLDLSRPTAGWLLAVLALTALRFAGGGPEEWEKAGRMSGFAGEALQFFQGNKVNGHLSQLIRTTYLPALLAWIGSLLYLGVRRHWADAGLFAGFSLLFAVIFLGTHPNWDVRPFTEIYFLTLALLLSLYVAFLVLRERRGWITAGLAALLLGQITRVAIHSQFFREREMVFANMVRQQAQADIPLAVIPFHRAPIGKISYPFAAGYESLVISAMAGIRPPVSFTFVHADTVLASDTAGTRGMFIISDWNRKPGTPGRGGPLDLPDYAGYRPFYPSFD